MRNALFPLLLISCRRVISQWFLLALHHTHSLISHTHTHSSYPAPSVWLCVIAAQPAWLDTRRPHHRLAQLNRSPSCALLIAGLPSESNVPNLIHTKITVRDIDTHIAITNRASFETLFYVRHLAHEASKQRLL